LQTNGIFQLQVLNAEKQTAIWTIDLKKTGTVYKGPANPKADVTLILSDEVFIDLAEGKVQHGLLLILYSY
jgi:putative sterol carrier protein